MADNGAGGVDNPKGATARLAPLLVLASSSPRRRALIEQMGAEATRICAPDIDETPLKAELPAQYALRLAVAKAQAVRRDANEIILAGDTCVALGRRILPAATSDDIVRSCLKLMSGRRQTVYSAVAVIDREGQLRSRLSRSHVTFKRLTTQEIDAYVASGEGLGKAGGYAIQGRAAGLIRAMSGSYTGIVGLPLFETRALLRASGLFID